MAHQHDKQQDRSFNWPPTAEELESIQVFDISGDTPPHELIRASTTDLTRTRETPTLEIHLSPAPTHPPDRTTHPPVTTSSDRAVIARVRTSAWRRFVADSAITQTGLLAASLAAIGIAITSMLAPGQPASRAPKIETRAAVATPAPGSASPTAAPTTSGHAAAAEQPTFRPMVTLELERPSASAASETHAQSGLQTQSPRAVAASSTLLTDEVVPLTAPATSTRATSRQTQTRARGGAAGRDPVSRFAVHTGLSVWKAMRVVGRAFKRDQDEHLLARRSRAT